ncbi:ATP-binding protein, partial [bacterium]|nr:ATP-binding protein [bacterium]
MIISPETLRIMEVISTFVITLGVVAVIATVICLFLADLNKKSNLSKTLKAFIKNYDLSKFKILTKSYPKRSHADLQLAINEFLVNKSFQIMGIEKEYSRDRASISNLLAFDMEGLKSIKANYTDYDFPDDLVIKAIQNGVYLVTTTSSKLLILVKESESYYNDDVIIEIATINDSCGEILLQEFKQEISLSLTSKSIYRGRSLLLNQEGKIDFICHKEVESKEVILPEHTKIVIDRQIIDFSNRLLDFTHYQQSSKKGVLLYGPPGTGKTHLISYIKTQLKNHTLLVINSENITMISGVFKMANLLQPSLVIIEDVDLLAKSRDLEAGPYSDMMLQSLMNELDGI